MADKKISELTSITGANTASGDLFVIVDVDANETKKITRDELTNALELTDFDNIDINGGTIDGTVIGGASAAAGTFTTLNATGGGSLTGTWSDLGSVTTVDINGGTIDGVTIGGASAGAGTFTSITGTGLTVDNISLDGSVVGLTANNNGRLADALNYLRFTDTDTSSVADQPIGEIQFYNSDSNGPGVNALIRGVSQFTSGISGLEFHTGGSGSPQERMRINWNGDISFYEDTGTTPKFFWDASAESLGIGTTSPSERLHVVAPVINTDIVRFTGANADRGLVISTAQSGGTNDSVIIYNADTATGQHAFQINGSERMRIDSSGNLGLGVTPSAWRSSDRALQLPYSSFSDNSVTTTLARNAYLNSSSQWIYRNSDEATRFSQANGAHFWENAASGTAGNTITWSERMRIDSSGRVGIGTSSPSTRLHVDGGSFLLSDSTTTNLTITGGTGNQCRIFFGDSGSSTQGRVAYDNSTDSLQVDTAGSERMRIDSSGNLLVGTTTAGAGAGFSTLLAVDGGSSVDPSIFKWSGGAISSYPLRTWNAATVGDNIFVNFATETSYTGRGSIDYNRAAGLVRYNTSSDANLKNILGDSDGTKSIEILNSTRIREFAWKEDESQKPQIGVIAQELYETYKGAVSVGGEIEKTDAEGNVTTEYRPWSVDKTAFTFHLVAGWQAHQKIIEELKSEIETLKAEVAALKGA